MDSDSMDSVDRIKSICGYTFRNPKLLERALTHRTFAKKTVCNNERMELMGDSILTLLVNRHFCSSYPALGPGKLTSLKAANLCNERLARIPVKHDLHSIMRIKSSRLAKQAKDFKEETVGETEEEIYGKSVKLAPKFLADVIEAIAGAIFEDSYSDLDTTWEALQNLLHPLITLKTLTKQPVEDLEQLVKHKNKQVKYHERKQGKMFVIDVLIDDRVVGQGISPQRRAAKRNASRQAIDNLAGVMSHILNQPKVAQDEHKGAKQQLEEICREKNWSFPIYNTIEMGPPIANKKGYSTTVRVTTMEKKIALRGKMKPRIEEAEQSAASNILKMIE